MIRFNSDYLEGAHPQIMQRLMETNMDQTPGYGEDAYCEQARDTIRSLCDAPEADVHFLVGGTQTNATFLAAVLKPWQGVISADTGHIAVHETGAVEATGHKVIALPNVDGRITAGQVDECCRLHFSDESHEHMVMPGAVYISNPTEVGTLYTREALVITREDIKRDFRYIIKQKGGMLAKGRLLGVQFQAALSDGLYMALSRHAIALAMRMKAAMAEMGIPFMIDSPTNQQFPILPDRLLEVLKRDYSFATIQKVDEKRTAVRFCTSWATRETDVDRLIEDLGKLYG